MKTHFVVTGIVQHNNKILILKKAPDDWNYPNKWSFCSGFIKEFEAAEDACLREIKEETGLDAERTKTGEIVEVIDKDKRWVVAVYLCKVNESKVTLCKENVEYKWVERDDIKNYDFVPALAKDLKSLGL